MLDDNVKSVAQRLFRAIGTPKAQECLAVLKTGQVVGFGSLRVDPSDYGDAMSYFLDAQAVGFLKKFDDPADKEALHRKAINLFFQCEQQCARTNLRFSDFVYNTAFYDGKDERLWAYVRRCKKLLRAWLGPIPADLQFAKFGKGATFSDPVHLSTIPDKMSSRPTLTPNATFALDLWTRTSWFRALAREYPHRSDPEIVHGNRFGTVAKDSAKRRCIGVEPSLNVFYQLAVGRVLRNRLRRLGIDLDKNQTVHRIIAQMSSRDGLFSTLDLSNASDTIAYRLVQALLPPMWFELLDSLRSPKTQVEGRWCLLEKFSSMGNGFTFELETLVFLALLAALDPKLQPGVNLYVYGDDIIVPSQYARSAVAALNWAGFTVNEEKSFLTGPFRESCGGDYFRGIAVRPAHLDKAPSQPTDWMSLANKFWHVAVNFYLDGDFGLAHTLDRRTVLGVFYDAWMYCLGQIPVNFGKDRENWRCKGPKGLGDVVLHTPYWEWTYRIQEGVRYFKCLVLEPKVRIKLKRYRGSVALASAVYGVASSGVVPRNTKHEPHLQEVPFSITAGLSPIVCLG